VYFPRIGHHLNTRWWDLPGWGDLTILRGQAALEASGPAGNPQHTHSSCTPSGGVVPAVLLAGRRP
jgi:hypothetical protein